jgi:hypothetical protein
MVLTFMSFFGIAVGFPYPLVAAFGIGGLLSNHKATN